MNISESQAAEWIEKIADKNELVATLKAELEAVKSERDFLRSILAERIKPVEITEPLFINTHGMW